MRIFVYEFVTGGGLLQEPSFGTPHGSLLCEGQAMLAAVCQDLLTVPEMTVMSLWDQRLEPMTLPGVSWFPVETPRQEAAQFRRALETCDAALLIAPELNGWLLQRCRQAEAIGTPLLSPGSEFIAATGDKFRTARFLQAADVPTPRTWLPGDPPQAVWPAVVKRRDGAGSSSVRRVDTPQALAALCSTHDRWIVQPWHAGRAASISFLCGPTQQVALPPCWQLLADTESFLYQGGERIADPAVVGRLEALARRALTALPDARGYIGVDLLVGQDATGGEDLVIEINPRLTTSYIGLRQIAKQNLGEAMLQIARGRAIDLSFSDRTIQFDASGQALVG